MNIARASAGEQRRLSQADVAVAGAVLKSRRNGPGRAPARVSGHGLPGKRPWVSGQPCGPRVE